MSKLPIFRSCPECFEKAEMTEWLPSPGFDPAMREYKCPRCGYEWYHIPKTTNIAKSSIPGSRDN